MTIEEESKVIEAHPGRLIINKIYSVEELLNMPIIAEGTTESIEQDINKEAKLQETMTNEEH